MGNPLRNNLSQRAGFQLCWNYLPTTCSLYFSYGLWRACLILCHKLEGRKYTPLEPILTVHKWPDVQTSDPLWEVLALHHTAAWKAFNPLTVNHKQFIHPCFLLYGIFAVNRKSMLLCLPNFLVNVITWFSFPNNKEWELIISIIHS